MRTKYIRVCQIYYKRDGKPIKCGFNVWYHGHVKYVPLDNNWSKYHGRVIFGLDMVEAFPYEGIPF